MCTLCTAQRLLTVLSFYPIRLLICVKLNNFYHLPKATAISASRAGILRRRRYAHRGSGQHRNRTIHHSVGTNIHSFWSSSRPVVLSVHRSANLPSLPCLPPASPGTTFGLLNVRSLSNKSSVLQELRLDNCIDILFLTETWQQQADAAALNILLLHDLSAAFDTVSHSILPSRLHELGIDGTALAGISSSSIHKLQLVQNSAARLLSITTLPLFSNVSIGCP
ncbi:hypothetical protein AOLI_G00073070 [Acnodon oligacanthus]